MKRLIYQVYVGNRSNLYDHCTKSVKEYANTYGIDYIVQGTPKLRIKPDIFRTNRSKESYEKYGGYLPIYEKENAFDYLDEYDQIAIIDADIYIRNNSPNIFEHFGTEYPFGGVVERDMPITEEYTSKIANYTRMQYGNIMLDWKWDNRGAEFFNMGMMLLNSSIKKYIKGSARQFVERAEFKDFVDGMGAWKWSTDQTLLNYWIKRYNIPSKKMSWRWNGLYKGIEDRYLSECHFVHFFLRDKLPKRGENIQRLMQYING